MNKLIPLMALLLGCSSVSAQLVTAELAEEAVARERVLDGVVEAVNKSTISAQTSGQVAEVLYDVEDLVEAGAVIVRLRDTEQRASLNKSEADLAEAMARLEEAKTELARQSELAEKDLVSKASLDRAGTAVETAKARVKAAGAGIKRQREQLQYTVIRAPYTGIVTQKMVNVGETVNPGTPLMEGFSLKELRVRTDVPQRLIAPIRRLQQARILDDHLRSYPVKDLTIFPYASEGSNTFIVRLDLDEANGDLFPGMLVKAAFVIGLDRRLVVPRQAVAFRGELTSVYVVGEDDKVQMRQVRLGHGIGTERIEILSGVSAGEKVALDPVAAGVMLREQIKAARHE